MSALEPFIVAPAALMRIADASVRKQPFRELAFRREHLGPDRLREALNLGLPELLQRQLAPAADLLKLAGHLIDAPLGGSQTLPKRHVHVSLALLDKRAPTVDLLGGQSHLPLDQLLALAVRGLQLGNLFAHLLQHCQDAIRLLDLLAVNSWGQRTAELVSMPSPATT